jgi:hypothetical protein
MDFKRTNPAGQGVLRGFIPQDLMEMSLFLKIPACLPENFLLCNHFVLLSVISVYSILLASSLKFLTT